MITGRTSLIYEVAALQAGIDRVVAGLRLVKVTTAANDRAGVSSGFLITSDLVVVPNFVAASTAALGEDTAGAGFQFECRSGSEPDRAVAARLVFTADGPDPGPALLRLEEAFDDSFLPLDIEEQGINDQVFVPQHPDGRPLAHLSIGRLRGIAGTVLQHDADTMGGSSGAPIMNASWKVIGMHVGRISKNDPAGDKVNEAISLSAVLAALRPSDAWTEIATLHRLVDVEAVREELRTAREQESTQAVPEDDLLAAAVRWRFGSAEFAPEIQSLLRPMTVDAKSPVWVLRPADRVRLLRSADSVEKLRTARGDERIDDPGQAVIDRILRDPLPALTELQPASLPYWLQAVRWFRDVVPGLPTTTEINQQLEKQRFRSRLEEISQDFRGREDELGRLSAWYESPGGPMTVTGVGGVGKSALVARFVLSLPDSCVVLWLDFDRVDLDPDDPVSVVQRAYEQLATQVQGVTTPTVDKDSWSEQLNALATTLAKSEAAPPLVVLDGFEIAQHAAGHNRLWNLLEIVLQHAPQTRVLVSGRAPVQNLVLAGQPAVPLALDGLAEEDATEWLEERIDDASVVVRVLQITRRVPLALQLALRLVEEDVTIEALPAELPDRLVDGYLYRRILDRVVDPLLKPVAQGALVLRRITEDLVEPVLGQWIPDGWSAADTFAGLAQEYGLVGDLRDTSAATGTGVTDQKVLSLRPEVRQATLRLLELDDIDRVHAIDQRAASFYAHRVEDDELDDAARAELVYHLLRSQDLAGAQQVWRDRCARLLVGADDDLPPGAEAERVWLSDRTRSALGDRPSTEVWEYEAAVRIRDLLARGLVDPVRDVLSEHHERSAASPLVLFDAWLAWRDGHSDSALATLQAAGPAEGELARDRTILRAALARADGALDEADRMLARLHASPGPDGAVADVYTLAVVAARVRLALDLPLEAELALRLGRDGQRTRHTVEELLPAADVVLPTLQDRLAGPIDRESLGERLEIPKDPSELSGFGMRLDDARRRSFTWTKSAEFRAVSEGQDPDPVVRPAASDGPDADIARYLAYLAQRRWRLAVTTSILVQAPLLVRSSGPTDSLELSVLGSLSGFAASERGQLNLYHPKAGPLDSVLEQALQLRTGVMTTSPLRELEAVFLSAPPAPDDRTFRPQPEAADGVLAQAIHAYTGPEYELVGVLLYLTSPDPLDQLVRRAVGLAEITMK